MKFWDISKAPEMPCCNFRCWTSVEEPSSHKKTPPNFRKIFYWYQRQTTWYRAETDKPKGTAGASASINSAAGPSALKGMCWAPVCLNNSGEPSWAGWPCHWGSDRSDLSLLSLPCYSSTVLSAMFLCFSNWALTSSRPPHLQQWPCVRQSSLSVYSTIHILTWEFNLQRLCAHPSLFYRLN